MNFLIFGITNDIHAVSVALALRRRGHTVDIHLGADFPESKTIAIEIGGNDFVASSSGVSGPIEYSCHDVVWNRRPVTHRKPQGVRAADSNFVARESRAAANGLFATIEPAAFWINPWEAALRAQNKVVQLKEAARVGLRVPNTLISNDPRRIREMLLRAKSGVVYKSFYQANWQNEAGVMHNLYARRIGIADLVSDAALRACPGIYQEAVDRSFEVRATFFGDHCVAARTSVSDTYDVDWRSVPNCSLGWQPYELPQADFAKCRSLMRELGIVFGCFDLIVDKTGNIVFLEVNEMGQFLWMERECPALPMLDCFVQFCEQPGLEFRYDPDAAQESALRAMGSEDSDEVVYMAAEAARHQPVKATHVFYE